MSALTIHIQPGHISLVTITSAGGDEKATRQLLQHVRDNLMTIKEAVTAALDQVAAD